MATDTQSVLDAAQKVADLLTSHPAVEKHKAAQKALQDDPVSSKLLKEFNSVLSQISHNERAGLPPTEEQRKKFEMLQTQIASDLKFKSYSIAEYDLTDLLRKVSQTWQKPLASARGAGAPGGGGEPASRLVM